MIVHSYTHFLIYQKCTLVLQTVLISVGMGWEWEKVIGKGGNRNQNAVPTHL